MGTVPEFQERRYSAILKKKPVPFRSRSLRSLPRIAKNRTFPGTLRSLGNFTKRSCRSWNFLRFRSRSSNFRNGSTAVLPFPVNLLRSRSRSRTVFISDFFTLYLQGSKCTYGHRWPSQVRAFPSNFGGLRAPIYFRFFCLEPLKSLPQSCFKNS